MTLVFAVQACDGIVVVADGLTTTPPNTDGDSAIQVPVQSEIARKLLRVPGQEIAVLLAGRATFGERDQKREASVVCAEFLATKLGPGRGVAGTNHSVELVARVLRDQFEQVCAEEQGAYVTALVAGYSPGSSNAECWRLSTLSNDPPERDLWFTTDFSSFEPEAFSAASQLIRDELIRDLGQHFQRRTSEVLIGCLSSVLPQLAETRLNEFPTIGGRWQLLGLSPDLPNGPIRCVDPHSWILPKS